MRTPFSTRVVLLFSMGLALVAGLLSGVWQHYAIQRTVEAQMSAASVRVIDGLKARVGLYEYQLRGARGALVAVGPASFTAEILRRYTATRDLSREFPGSLGQGVVRRVRPEEEAAFVEAASREHPGFYVHQLGPNDGEKFVIQHLEPEASNRPALGLDLASEPRRRAAALGAAKSGEPTLSAPISLVQVEGEGALLFLPFYRTLTVPPTEAERERELLGWVYTPLVIDKVFKGFDAAHLSIDVHDVTDPEHPLPILLSEHGEPTLRRDLTVYGRTWRATFAPRPGFVTAVNAWSPESVTFVVASVWAAVSVALVTLRAMRRRRREAQSAQARLQLHFQHFAESLPLMAWTCDSTGACNYLSPQWAKYTGEPIETQLGTGWFSQIHDDDRARAREKWTEALNVAQIFDAEFRIRRADGTYRWFKTRAMPECDSSGRISQWFGSNTDIQDLKDAEQRARQLALTLEARVAERTNALRDSNAELESIARQLQLAQRVSHVGSWETNLSTGHTVWSSELCRIIGAEPSSLLPSFEALKPFFGDDAWAGLFRGMTEVLAGGREFEVELEMKGAHPDVRRMVIVQAKVIETGTAAPQRLVGTLQDVTERHRVREKVQELTERLQLATSAAQVGVWDWIIRDDALVWDDTMYRLYGVSRDQFAGAYHAWKAAVHRDDLERTERELNDCVTGVREFNTTFRIVLPDGRYRYLRAAAALFRDPETGAPSRLVGVNWDITEQKVAEQSLRRNEALQRSILANAGSAVIATDTQGVITLFNRAAEQLLGYQSDEVVGKVTPAIIHVAEEVEVRRLELERERVPGVDTPFDVFVALARLGTTETREWVYVRKDSSRVPVLLTVSALRDDAGELTGFLGIAVNLEERKKHERELLRLNAELAERTTQAESASHAKSMFLANVSHEIRTPMGAVTGLTYLLGKTVLSDEQRKLVATIEQATGTLVRMINDVLDLSKIEARQFSLDLSVFSLSEALDEVFASMQALATRKELDVVLDAATDLPELLRGDRVRLVQVLTNLVGNAIKFTPRGSVRLGVREMRSDVASTTLRFEVTDTGPGIDPALRARLFTPFSQGDTPENRRVGGTGLGLAIVKQLTEQMGGDVGVDSTLGQGSTFWCTMTFGKSLNERELSSRNLRVLLLETVGGLEAFRSARRLGWAASEVPSAARAVRLLREAQEAGQPFDLVLVDSATKDLSELAFAALEFERHPERQRPGIVVVTSTSVGALEWADAVLAPNATASGLYDTAARVVSTRGKRFTLDRPRAELGQRLPGVNLLVVDDSDVNRDIARRILSLEGANVECAADGVEAVESVRRSPGHFAAIVMDVQMPNVDGIEATRRLRADPANAAVPIIALTAGALASERQRALDAGMTDFVTKPFQPENLIQVLRSHIERTSGMPMRIASRVRPSALRDWPVIEGIDTDDASLRLGGDRALFRDLLQRLAIELGRFCSTFDLRSATCEPTESLRSECHRIRGIAGNLGAVQLATLAAQLEGAVVNGYHDQLRSVAPALAQEAQRVHTAVLRELQVTAASEKTNAPAGPLKATDVARLVRCLEENDLGALDLYASLSAALVAALGADLNARLSAALSALDFKTARSVMSELKHDRTAPAP